MDESTTPRSADGTAGTVPWRGIPTVRLYNQLVLDIPSVHADIISKSAAVTVATVSFQ